LNVEGRIGRELDMGHEARAVERHLLDVFADLLAQLSSGHEDECLNSLEVGIGLLTTKC